MIELNDITLLRLIRENNPTTYELCPGSSFEEYRTVSRRLTAMERHGWIVRSKSSCWRWSLTAKGQEVLNGHTA